MNRSFSKKRHIQESNLILEQRRFNKLLESKMGDVKPLVSEQGDFEEKAKRLADKGLAQLGIESPFNRNSETGQTSELPSMNADSGNLSQSKLDLPFKKSKIKPLMSDEEMAKNEQKANLEKQYLQSLTDKINAETPLEQNLSSLKTSIVGRGVTFYQDAGETKPLSILLNYEGIRITDIIFDAKFGNFRLTFKSIAGTEGTELNVKEAVWDCNKATKKEFILFREDRNKYVVYQTALSDLLQKAFCTTSKGGTPILKTGGFTQNKTNRPTDNMA